MSEPAKLKATAHVKLSVFDENGQLVRIDEHEVELTEEEAKQLWLSQQPE